MMSATFVRMTGSQKADEKEDFSTVKWIQWIDGVWIKVFVR